MPEHSLRFLVNGDPVEVSGMPAQTTVLEYLREKHGLTGTKEGCAEGDCGACTVVLAEPDGRRLAWKPVNACIPAGLGRRQGHVHRRKPAIRRRLAPSGPAALVDCHGSQCGFCTPGFVMSLFGLYKNARDPSPAAIADAISGNLCRCTGYRPIRCCPYACTEDSATRDATGWRSRGIAADGSRRVSTDEERLALQLASLAGTGEMQYEAEGRTWFAPRTPDTLRRRLPRRIRRRASSPAPLMWACGSPSIIAISATSSTSAIATN